MEIEKIWDKTFSLDKRINHHKVTFKNHFGITLVADMYEPKDYQGQLPAIAVCGPYGAVKEQCSGLYAMEMSKRGFITIAFDPSYTGESSGNPRYISSPDINTEDYQAAVDYLRSLNNVDKEKISIIGICGWGGIAVNAAAIDPRIKVTVASTLYDMTRIAGNGYNDVEDNEESRYEQRKKLVLARDKDYKNNNYDLAGGVIDPLPLDAPQFIKDYHAYYKTKRGYHKRSLNSNNGWCIQNNTSWLNARFMYYASEIKSAVLVVHGTNAHSYYMGKDVYKMLKGNNKKMLSIEGATHCDLYDQLSIIPFDEIEKFIKDNIK